MKQLSLFIPVVINTLLLTVPLLANSAPNPAEQISSFTIVNADTDKDIVTSSTTGTITLTNTPHINIRANVLQQIGSIVFSNNRTENSAPFAYNGDSKGNYYAWSPKPGIYVITATAYSQKRGKGKKLSVASFTLVVNADGQPSPSPSPSPSPTATATATTSPVPTQSPSPQPTASPIPTQYPTASPTTAPTSTKSPTVTPAASPKPDVAFGKMQYESNELKCSICHGKTGKEGILPLVPFKTFCSNCTNLNTLATFIAANMPDKSGKCVGNCASSVAAFILNSFENVAAATPTPPSPTTKPSTSSALYRIEDIELISAESTLRQASLLLQGRLPTAEENTAVLTNGERGLDASLDLLFKSNGFYETLGKIYNDELNLTRDVDDARLVTMNLGINWWGTDNAMRNKAYAAIRNAGIELVQYIAKNDKPISEILTADYMMVNPFSARTFDIYNDLGFNTPDDENDWKPAKLTKRLVGSTLVNGNFTPGTWQNFTTGTDGSFGHSGLLTDVYWLENYPFTNSNLNRMRARLVLKQFLDFDILMVTTGSRILSANDGDNPTINNPNCTVCHRTLDSIASTFLQRYNLSTYNPLDQLTRTSLWPVGFGAKLFPVQQNGVQMGTQNPLQWLGKELVQDPRFLQAQVHIIYRGLIGKDVIRLRDDMPAIEYQAYQAQQALFAQIIAKMRANNSNIKIAVRELIKSPYFRANGINNTNNLDAHLQTGSVRLLPAAVINNKAFALLGANWTDNANPDLGNSQFLRFESLYGVPSASESGVSSTASTTNVAIQQQFASDMSCRLVPREFYERNSNNRRLLKWVDINTAPFNPDGSANAANIDKILRTIQHLYLHLLDLNLPLDHADIQNTYQLWLSTWRKGNAALAAGTATTASPCQLTVKPVTRETLAATDRILNDRNYVLRSWMVTLNYLLTDPRFFYQ